MRRQRLWTKFFKTIDEMANYIKQVKDINGNKVQVEMNECAGEYCVVVWWLK